MSVRTEPVPRCGRMAWCRPRTPGRPSSWTRAGTWRRPPRPTVCPPSHVSSFRAAHMRRAPPGRCTCRCTCCSARRFSCPRAITSGRKHCQSTDLDRVAPLARSCGTAREGRRGGPAPERSPACGRTGSTVRQPPARPVSRGYLRARGHVLSRHAGPCCGQGDSATIDPATPEGRCGAPPQGRTDAHAEPRAREPLVNLPLSPALSPLRGARGCAQSLRPSTPTSTRPRPRPRPPYAPARS